MRSCRGVLFRKRQFAAEVIVTCVRWYLRFSLSLRDVEELMAERAYCGLALQTRSSGEYRFTGGQLQHSKKLPALRGLNANHNHDLKNVFKSAATHVSTSPDALGDFYRNLLAKGMKPAMARLTLARKMAAIVLTIWKKGERFDPGELKRQAA